MIRLSWILIRNSYRMKNLIPNIRNYNHHYFNKNNFKNFKQQQQQRRNFNNINETVDDDNILTYIVAGVCVAWFSLQTIFKDKIVKRIETNADSKETMINFNELIANTLEMINFNESFKQTLPGTFHLCNNTVEPFTIGSLQTHFGANFILPFYYQYNNLDEINDKDLNKLLNIKSMKNENINNDINNNNNDNDKELKNLLLLSNDAKKFSLLSLLYNNEMPMEFFAKNFSLFLLPFLMNEFTNFLLRKQRRKNFFINLFSIIIGYNLYYLFQNYLKKLQLRYSYYYIFQNHHQDNVLINSYDEYFNHLIKLQKIINNNNNGLINQFIQLFLTNQQYYSYENQLEDCRKFHKIIATNDKNELKWSDIFTL